MRIEHHTPAYTVQMPKEEHRGPGRGRDRGGGLAIKEIAIKEIAIKDLRNEIAIMERLSHLGVLRVMGVGEVVGSQGSEGSGGRPFLLLERLATVLAAVLPKPADQAPGTHPYSVQLPHLAQYLLSVCFCSLC